MEYYNILKNFGKRWTSSTKPIGIVLKMPSNIRACWKRNEYLTFYRVLTVTLTKRMVNSLVQRVFLQSEKYLPRSDVREVAKR